MNKQEILEEMVEYYSQDTSRRSLNQSGACVYFAENGNRCAVSRLCREDKIEDLMEYEQVGVDSIPLDKLNDMLTVDVTKADIKFLCDLQDLHDEPANWTKYGISITGEERVREIMDEI